MMDKKLIYRKIRQLQLFRYAYNLSNHTGFDGNILCGSIYEITKLWYDSNKNLQKSIEYAYVKSNNQFPIYDGFGVFDIHVSRLDVKDINRLLAESRSYGIDIDRCASLNV